MFVLILRRRIKVTSCPMAYKTSPDDAYMRQNESILLSPGGGSRLQDRIHLVDQSLASPPTEAFRMVGIYPLSYFSRSQNIYLRTSTMIVWLS